MWSGAGTSEVPGRGPPLRRGTKHADAGGARISAVPTAVGVCGLLRQSGGPGHASGGCRSAGDGLLLDHYVPGGLREARRGSHCPVASPAAWLRCLAAVPPHALFRSAFPVGRALILVGGMGKPPRPRTLGVGTDTGACILARWLLGGWHFRTSIHVTRTPYRVQKAVFERG